MNTVAMTGRITKTPVIEEVGNEKKFKKCTFTIMVKTKRKIGEGSYRSDAIQCEATGGLLKTLELIVVKGSPLAITGEIRTNSWGGGETFRQYSYINVEMLEVLENKEQTDKRKALLEEKEKSTPS